jgi:hypothetical protein
LQSDIAGSQKPAISKRRRKELKNFPERYFKAGSRSENPERNSRSGFLQGFIGNLFKSFFCLLYAGQPSAITAVISLNAPPFRSKRHTTFLQHSGLF